MTFLHAADKIAPKPKQWTTFDTGERAIAVTTIVLAAGESSRMGQPKQLLSWGGKTVLEHVLDNLAAAGLTDIIIVLGFRAKEIADCLSGLPVKLVVNRYYRRGMSSSIRAGMKHVPAGSGIMLFLADQPLVGPETLEQMVARFEQGKKGIVVPVHRGQRGNPVIFHPRYRGQIDRLRGDIGAREIVAFHADDVAEVPAPAAVLQDIDTKGDYRRARETANRDREGTDGACDKPG